MIKNHTAAIFVITALVSILSTLNAHAQFTKDKPYFLPKINPQAPNTASLGKYGNYPVNYISGVPDISIPLYEIEAGGLKVPVTLSYHASGNKVTDFASWAGLGWSVQAGGQVSRRMMGKADEDTDNGYFLGKLRVATTLNLSTVADQDYLLKVTAGNYDTEPDIFSYSFPGKSGKFFFDGTNNYRPVLIPFAPVAINKTKTNNLLSFNIMDEHGNNYVFGKTTAELSDSYSYGIASSSYNGWPLESIISANRRDTVSFSYTSQFTQSGADYSERCVVEDQIINAGVYQNYVSNQGSYFNSNDATYTGAALLNQIKYKNGKVDFGLSVADRTDNRQGTKSLDNIKISAYNYATKAYQVLKTIRFYTSYFPGAGANLRLDSLDVQDMSGATVQRYHFSYEPLIHLPLKTTLGKDHWGYFNNRSGQSHLIPQQLIDFQNCNGCTNVPITIGSNDINGRDPDPNYMQADILKTIGYPTGGRTDFEYETNSYQDAQLNTKYAGGLRIKTIKSYDGINTLPIVKTYKYGINENGFGRKNFLLNYYYYTPTQLYQYRDTINRFQWISEKRLRTFTSNSTNLLIPYDETPVTYANVTEYIGDGTTNTGKIIYQFTDAGDVLTPASSVRPIVNSYFYARGQLLVKSVYKNNGGSYSLVEQENNSYSAFAQTFHTNVGFVADKTIINENINADSNTADSHTPALNANAWHTSNYSITSDDNYLISSTTNNYDILDPTKYNTSTTSYTYSDTTYQQIAKTMHTSSRGNTNISVNKYAFNYLNGSTTGNAVLDTMLNRHMYSAPVEKRDSIYYPLTATGAIIGGQLNTYKYGTLPFTVVPNTISTLSVAAPLTNFTQSRVTSGNLTADSRYVQMISFDNYDTQNNIVQYTPRNSTPVSVIWDYQNEFPVSQIKNAAYNTTAYTSFEANGKGNWYFNGIPVTDVTAPTGSRVYPLSSGAISPITVDNTKSYVLSYWSNNGAATVYAGSNISGAPLRVVNGWTYYEHQIPAGSAGSMTISGSSSIDELRLYPVAAQMTTYAYNPSGLTAIADTKGSINRFEYDAFSRLKNVKDWNGNIVKNYGYHTYDQVVPNDLIPSTTFTRDNCPAGTSPQSATYSVPANRYYSSTKASANAQAQYDLTTNGQALADNPAICGCPIQMIPFTLSNTTGIGTFRVTFSGPSSYTFTFPANGSNAVQVAYGSYTVQIFPTGDFSSHTISLGTRPSVHVPGTTFNNVSITSSTNESPLSITP